MSIIFVSKKEKGFTLIELMVSVSIFVLVMVISMGAILSILDANQKSETMRSVMDNLDSTLESMTRTIRFGTNYHSGSTMPLTSPHDTFSNDDVTTMSVLDSDGNEVTYSLVGGQIMRSINSGNLLALTSPDINIQTLIFKVVGSLPYDTGDTTQPFVLIIIKGTVTGNRSSGSTFTIETTVSQRQLDSQ